MIPRSSSVSWIWLPNRPFLSAHAARWTISGSRVPLFAVARAVGENEVVAEVHGVTRPSDEVIHVRVRGLHR